MNQPTRRSLLKALGSTTAGLGLSRQLHATPSQSAADSPTADDPTANYRSRWEKTPDRVWLDGHLWANPMEDWRIEDGAAVCLSAGGNRNVHLITHQLTNPRAGFETEITLEQYAAGTQDGGAGWMIGVKSELNEYRSNTFAGGGLPAGIHAGQLVLAGETSSTPLDPSKQAVRLRLIASAENVPEDQVQLTLIATGEDDTTTELSAQVPVQRLLGNLCFSSNFRNRQRQARGAKYRFRDWQVSGEGFHVDQARRFGPILWSMYSLSDSRSEEGFVLKISALTGPLGQQDNQRIELWTHTGDEQWQSRGTAKLDQDAWTATFRIPNWDASQPHDYRLLYEQKFTDGTRESSEWTGTIQANPSGRPLRLAALTCQNHYAFPYAPVANNVLNLKPDLIYFSGDQLYESHGGYGLIREPADAAILNYLRKFYMFGWAFREAMRYAPTLCIPDDHDVFQGNIWGEGGARMKDIAAGTSSKGGYREPARMVNVVHKTNASHHPDFYQPSPVTQGISVYYGDMVYGNVGFAILGDRQFKSGPERVETGSGRADHVKDPDFDTSQLDQPGLVLLGERQEEFLRRWAKDWRGHALKVVLSQTVFAGVATHHGSYDGFLAADLDSGGWPQTARNRAIEILREAKPLHVNGDQHLTSLVQYGVQEQRDAFWSFCTPAIAAGYPRWWRPDELGMPHENRPQHGLEHTGEYRDGFGNPVYVYAIGNPQVGRAKNRYQRAHEKGSGFGLVTIDPEKKTYHIESFRFLVDALNPQPEDQFPGWPVTIGQQENAGNNEIS